jgi:hypothetical protein
VCCGAALLLYVFFGGGDISLIYQGYSKRGSSTTLAVRADYFNNVVVLRTNILFDEYNSG